MSGMIPEALPAEPDSEEQTSSLGMFLHNPIHAKGEATK